MCVLFFGAFGVYVVKVRCNAIFNHVVPHFFVVDFFLIIIFVLKGLKFNIEQKFIKKFMSKRSNTTLNIREKKLTKKQGSLFLTGMCLGRVIVSKQKIIGT